MARELAMMPGSADRDGLAARPAYEARRSATSHPSSDALAPLDQAANVVPRSSSLAPPVDPALTTKVVQWNDLEALEGALRPGDVACVLAEPLLTNIGIIHPAPGFHEEMRRICTATGTLL